MPATPAGTCTSVAANTATANLTGLAKSTSYTFKAYSDNTCTSANELATAAAFTTTTPTLAASSVTHNSATLTLTGWTVGTGTGKDGNWRFKQTTPATGTYATCSAEQTGTTASLSSLATDTAYTFKAYSDASCGTEITTNDTDVTFTPVSGAILLRNSADDADITTLDVAEGGSASYKVKLSVLPTASVTVTIGEGAGDDDDTDITVSTPSGKSLTFTTTDWNTAQTVTLAAAEDSNILSGSRAITHTASGTGSGYAGTTASLTATEVDNDKGIVLSATTLSVAENASATYTVALSVVPTGDVTVALTATGDAGITFTPSSLTFTTNNWSTAQTITVSAAEDANTTDETKTITHTASSGGYGSVSTATLTATADDDTVTLTAGTATATTNTLTIANHTAAWWYKSTTTGKTTCTAVAANTATVNLTGLTQNTSYTFTAYSDNACTTGNLLATATAFTTTNPALTSSNVATTTATLTLSGWTAGTGTGKDGNWYYKATTGPHTTCSAEQTETTVNLTGLTPGTAYAYAAYSNSTCASANEIATASTFTTQISLSASSITRTGATLTIAGHTAAWWYKSATAGATTCTSVAANTASTNVTGLTKATSYTFTAYSNSDCSTSLASTSAFYTVGVVHPSNTTVIEGNTKAYRVRLGTQPTHDVTVTITAATSGNNIDEHITIKDTDDSTSGDQTGPITFTSSNWSTERVVTLQAAADTDNHHGLRDIIHTAASVDTNYGGATSTLTAHESDDDPGMHLAPHDVSVSEGGSATYKITLTTVPTSPVTVALTATGDSDITFTPTSVSFTGVNYDYYVGKTITVSAASDTDATNGTKTITHTTTSLDSNYNSLTATLTATESDITPYLTATNITITTATLNISRHTSAWWYQRAAPSGDTTCHSVAANTATAGVSSLSAGVTYTYKAYSDSSCSTEVTTDDTDVTFTTTKNIVLTPSDGVTVNEGGTATYTLKLAAAPTSSVSVAVAAATTGDNTDSDITVKDTDDSTTGDQTTPIVFNSNNWNTARTVTLTAAADTDFLHGKRDITHTATSADANYSGSTATLTATEVDTPGLTVSSITLTGATLTVHNHTSAWWYKSATAGATTCTAVAANTTSTNVTGLTKETSYTFTAYSNSDCSTSLASTSAFYTAGIIVSLATSVPEGSTKVYRVRLGTQPTHNVTVAITAATTGNHTDEDITIKDTDDSTSGDQTGPITFTSSTWSTERVVTLQAAEDNDTLFGSRNIVHTATSADTIYSGLTATLTAHEVENDPTIYVVPTTLTVTENGSATYKVKLTTEPTSPVTVALTSTGDSDITFSPTSVTFTETGYQYVIGKTITVSAAFDLDVINGTKTITHTTTSLDSNYNGLTATLTATESDNTSTLTAGSVTRNGATLTLTGYTGTNWYYKHDGASATCSTAQTGGTATVTGLDHSTSYTFQAYIDSGCQTRISTTASFTTAGLVLTPTAPTVNERDTGTYTVKLSQAPTANVSVAIAAATTGANSTDTDITVKDTDDGTTGDQTTAISFTTNNWNTARTVTLAAADDADKLNGARDIVHTLTSTDSKYGGLTLRLTATEMEDDREIVVTPATLSVTEGSSATYTVRLNSVPTQDVTVALTSSGDSDITYTPASLSFTSSTWSTDQTVTVSAASDTDNTNGVKTITHTATSTDSNYGGRTATVRVTESDTSPKMDVSGITATGATLELANHSTAWWYKQTSPSMGSCTSVTAGTTTQTLSDLTASTVYAYSTYSKDGCASADELDSLSFATAPSTTGTVSLVVTKITTTSATVAISGYTGAWWHTTETTGCVAVASGTSSVSATGLSPATDHTFTAHNAGTCADSNKLATAVVITTATQVVVGNLDEPTASSGKIGRQNLSNFWWQSVPFHTGSASKAPNGYTLESLTMDFAAETGSPNGMDIKLYQDSGGSPGTERINLGRKDPTGAGQATWDCSGTCRLESNTTYHVSPAWAGFGNGTYYNLNQTGSDSETVTPSTADWTIDNVGREKRNHNTSWYNSGTATGKVKLVAMLNASLASSSVTSSGATLTLSHYGGAWWYERTAPSGDTTCHSVASGTTTVTLSSLDAGTSYTYKAYNNSGCNAADEIASETFTTPVSLTVSNITSTRATITIAGHTGAWWYKSTTTGKEHCTAAPADTYSVTFTDLTANTGYIFSAYSDSSCRNLLATAGRFETPGS